MKPLLALLGILAVVAIACSPKGGGTNSPRSLPAQFIVTNHEPRQPFNVRTFGAVGDGKTMDRAALQAAIDAANKDGGGVVLLPPGVYLTGSLRLKSRVTLQLASGATLLGSTSSSDYSKLGWAPALLQAEGEENLTITGGGTIDGQGRALAQDVMRLLQTGQIRNGSGRTDRPDEGYRPMLIAFQNCRRVTLTGIKLKDSACWVQNFTDCEDLVLDHLRVDSTAFWNNDGFDISDCRRVKVLNCDVNSADDGICLKSEEGGSGCLDVEISDCRIRSSASAIKFGTASHGGFKNIRVKNLDIRDTFRSAIALEIVDGGVMENIVVENVRATNTGNAIFMRLGHRNQATPVGAFRNVVIRNVKVEVPAGKPDAGYEIEGPPRKEPHNIMPSSIVGLPGHSISNVLLENIEILYPGGADSHRAEVPLTALATVPECAGNYPEFSMFGELPAWGFYVRHAEGIRFKNVRISLKQKDFRPAMVFEDVQQIKLDQVDIQSAGQKSVIAFQGDTGTTINGTRAPASAESQIPASDGGTVKLVRPNGR